MLNVRSRSTWEIMIRKSFDTNVGENEERDLEMTTVFTSFFIFCKGDRL